MVELMLPLLSRFLEADLRMAYFGDGGMLLPILLLTLLVGAAGGLYPAVYLSRFQPAQVLRANKSSGEPAAPARFAEPWSSRSSRSRSADDLHRRRLRPDGLRAHFRPRLPPRRHPQIEGIARRQLVERSEALAREIGRVPGVVSVGRTGIGVDTEGQLIAGIYLPGRQQPVGIGVYDIDSGFFPTMGWSCSPAGSSTPPGPPTWMCASSPPRRRPMPSW
jgi:putative ABC transport system permease protein